jgi:3-methyladenine DNA glycosylase Mpg
VKYIYKNKYKENTNKNKYMTSKIEKKFKEYAEKLLNNTILEVKNKKYRICEIEMYYCNDDHPDKYTHCDDWQMKFNKFYPHRFKNKVYKAGTYKCMDIAYGDEKTKTYFGILIRSIENIETNEFFTGPCISVNEILSNYSMKEFKEFMEKYDIDKEFTLKTKKLDHEDIYTGPRVGLGDKYPEYKEKNYRYAIKTKKIKKQKKFELLN